MRARLAKSLEKCGSKMFVHNRSDNSQNHAKLIESKIRDADEICLAVSYVTRSGVNMFLADLKDKPVKLICTFEMNITELEAMQQLLKEGISVKIYHSSTGTFHPKVWLFKRGNSWTALVGSSNFTRGGLQNNIEASVFIEKEPDAKTAWTFFEALWRDDHAELLTPEKASQFQEIIVRRSDFRRKIIRDTDTADATSKAPNLFEFIKSWADVDKKIKFKSPSGSETAYWRGWYIVPDQYEIDDQKIRMLKDMLPFIQGEFKLNGKNQISEYKALLEHFMKESHSHRRKHSLSSHELFVRQAKNYMIAFGWAEHVGRGKSTIRLTNRGERVRDASSLETVKDIYTEYFWNRTHHGIYLVRFVKAILERLEYIDFEEFNYFVFHADNEEDLETIIQLIKDYRDLSPSGRNSFDERVNHHLKEVKDPTGKSVVSNYRKNIRYGLLALAWCNPFTINDDLTVRLAKGGDED